MRLFFARSDLSRNFHLGMVLENDMKSMQTLSFSDNRHFTGDIFFEKFSENRIAERKERRRAFLAVFVALAVLLVLV